MLCTAAVALLIGSVSAAAPKPNIVWFVTDDQDQMLGSSFPQHNGVGPMPQTKALMEEKGSMALNFFIHTPICCPSRSELVTGMYFHNIKAPPNRPGAPRNGSCMHTDDKKVQGNMFAKYLAPVGYKVGLFGKYLNTSACSPLGDFQFPLVNYTTSVVGNLSIEFITKVVKEGEGKTPFFAYVAPKAAHEPFNPAPWYRDHWEDAWPATEPRPASWNCSAESRSDHHGNIATEPLMTEQEAVVVTGIFKNRWRALMSVDDVIAGVIHACEELGVADNTYFFYSSDHGFQLGEFNIPMDKRQPYDFDTRIHLLARGPGIKPGSTWSQPATQVDMAPTFLGIAGLAKPSTMDGHSLLPLLTAPELQAELPEPTAEHLAELGGVDAYKARWRDAAFIEYYYVADNDKCFENCTYPTALWPTAGDYDCTDLVHNRACWGGKVCNTNCYATESIDNNFIVLRSMAGSRFGNTLYAEFMTGNQMQEEIDFATHNLTFTEFYEMDSDPWMMQNKAEDATTPAAALSAALHVFYDCAGDTCP